MRASRRRRPRPAAAATELALILPLLMLIVLGCVDFGRFACTQVAVRNAARAGAGYAIMHPEASAPTLAAGVQQAAVTELARQTGCDPARLSTTVTVIPELATSQHPTVMFRVRVTATYNAFETVVDWVGIPHIIPITATVEMRVIR
jgi:Flp pilus assembly protein TadG